MAFAYGGDNLADTSANSVRGYLEEHPEFLLDHPQHIQKSLEIIKQRDEQERIRRQRLLLDKHDSNSDHPAIVTGNTQGNLTLYEFTDFQCKHCVSSTRTLEQLLTEDPNLRVISKPMPPSRDLAEQLGITKIPSYIIGDSLIVGAQSIGKMRRILANERIKNRLIGGSIAELESTVDKAELPKLNLNYWLISFGFTYCPDICPTTLATIGRTMGQVGDRASEIQPIFITLDPERDTVDKLSDYVAYFHPTLLGLSGTQTQIAQIASSYGVSWEKQSYGTRNSDYTISHSAHIYLMDRNGKYISKFPYDISANKLADEIKIIFSLSDVGVSQ